MKEPAPTYGHRALSTRIVSRLLARVQEDLVVAAPSDVVLDELNVHQPDVLVLRSIPRRDVRFARGDSRSSDSGRAERTSVGER